MTWPDDFWWGTGSSATQTEGAAPNSDWFRWEQAGRAPRSGDGNGFAHRYAADFRVLADFGLIHHRMTLDWARLEPEPGRHDPAAVEHYLEVLKTARDAGISVWAGLHQVALPGWFSEDQGGFVDDQGRSYLWPRHVDWVAETFGDLVSGWVPIDQPGAFATRGWATATGPPGLADPEEFAFALRAAHLANHEAWRLLRSGEPPVMAVHHLAPIRPGVTSRHPDELVAAEEGAHAADALVWGWTRALRDGVLEIPGLAAREIPDMAGSFDLVGFTYSGARTVYADGHDGPYPADALADLTGDSPWPEGLGITVRRLADELPGRPLVAAGLGVATQDDAWRTDVLRDSLTQIEAAIDDGVDLRGAFFRTGIDAYEWEHGHDAPFGLFDRDRSPRESAELARAWATRSGNVPN
jgi:beta-glucosidase